MRKIELLSPAGDAEAVRSAFFYGADAVYAGGEGFGLRENAAFSFGDLKAAVEYAHGRGGKLYLACNAVANNADVDAFSDYIKKVAEISVDGVIASDLGIFGLVRSLAPEIPVHVSTQAGVMNYASANMLYQMGAKRIILARETSLGEIKRIRAETPEDLQIETFVHGAMCMAFSGRCLISSYLTGRNANRGQCAQPCRWNYFLAEETRPNEFFNVFEEDGGSYILNSKDLSMLEHIGELAESGATTFKIEGRAKTAYYTAVITNAYRAAIDAWEKGEPLPEWAKREVNCVSHRPYCTGFYLGVPDEGIQSYENSGYIRDCDFVGVVGAYNGDTLEITQRNYFTTEDYLEVIAPGNPPSRIAPEYMENSKGERITVANRAVETLYIKCRNGGEFPRGSMIRRVNKQ